jgi:hypothetical protein
MIRNAPGEIIPHKDSTAPMISEKTTKFSTNGPKDPNI